MTDDELVAKVQNGNKQAFNLLVLKYQHKIVALANRFVHDYDEAQDIAQISFIKAYKALAKFRGDSAFYTWLYRITANTAKNHLSTRKRRPPNFDIDINDAEQTGISTGLSDNATPEHNLMRDDIREVIESAMQNLSYELRTAITLRELEGLSYEEIAEIMNCPIGTIRSRIFRAREAIDLKLQPLLDDT